MEEWREEEERVFGGRDDTWALKRFGWGFPAAPGCAASEALQFVLGG